MTLIQTDVLTFECPCCFKDVPLDKRITVKRMNYESSRYMFVLGYQCPSCKYVLNQDTIQQQLQHVQEQSTHTKVKISRLQNEFMGRYIPFYKRID